MSTSQTVDRSHEEAELPTHLVLPVIALRDTVIFPGLVASFAVASARAIRALESLRNGSDLVGVAIQRKSDVDADSLADVREIGVVARVMKAVKEEDDSHAMVIARVMRRVRFEVEIEREPFLRARAILLEEQEPAADDRELTALMQNVRELCTQVITSSATLPNELAIIVAGVEEPSALADFSARLLSMSSRETRIELLEQLDVKKRLSRVYEELLREKEQLELRHRIHAAAEAKIGKAEREFFLREQLSAIRRELGEIDTQAAVIDDLRAKIDSVGLPEAAKTEANRELSRLSHMPPESAEGSVVRTYLDWMVTLPWQKTSASDLDLVAAQKILDEDHWDLEKVKERIIEFLAVSKMRKDLRGSILCFVGPPGVGKTSVGKSIARASGRAFVRVSLGGMRDEAEIRGHRRTYVGALPGQIIQGMRRAGTRDPVFMLDEIDKLGKDFRGDPEAALMEVLDPEQNAAFRDHYIDVPFDLSKVLFITTANVIEAVSPVLVDRMEILELPGYSDLEKAHIAKQFLIPKEVREHGVGDDGHIRFTDEAILEIIRRYTRESGVRNLERAIGSVCRKLARQMASGDATPWTVTPALVHEKLGVPRFEIETAIAERTKQPGVALALAWTPQGGELLFVETTKMPRDKGEVTMTGHLGDVMMESARTALSWLRANASHYGIADDAFRTSDLHIHVPAGAVPKDGPSAGVVLAAALLSLFTGRPVRPYVAMTGEITLLGQVLPIGGVKEKVLAAKRSGVREIVMPKRNEPNVVEDLPKELKEGLTFHFVSTLEEALDRVLTSEANEASKPHTDKQDAAN